MRYRVILGGSHLDDSGYLRSTVRDRDVPKYRLWDCGFRLVVIRRRKP